MTRGPGRPPIQPTPAQREAIIREARAGRTLTEIGGSVGLSKLIVRRVLAEHGVKIRRGPRHTGPKPRTVKLAERVRRLRDQGCTFDEIADDIGLSSQRAHQLVAIGARP